MAPCYNGIEAFQAYSDNPKRFDLIFTDHAMPGMTGLELARRIRKVDRTMPILLYSGFTGDISSQSVADCGIGAVLNKPALIRDIAKAIRGLLDRDAQAGGRRPVPGRKRLISTDAEIDQITADLD